MNAENNQEPVKVFSGTIWQAELLRSLLEDAGIASFLKDEFNGTMFPWVISPGGAGAVKVIVAGENAEAARSIVAEYEKSLEAELDEEAESGDTEEL